MGRFPSFQGRDIETFFRNSPEAFAFVLSQIFGCQRPPAAATNCYSATRAGSNRGNANCRSALPARHAAGRIRRRLRRPRTACIAAFVCRRVPSQASPGPGLRGKREVETVTRVIQLPTTIAPTRYLRRSPTFFRKRRVLEAFGSMASRGPTGERELDQAARRWRSGWRVPRPCESPGTARMASYLPEGHPGGQSTDSALAARRVLLRGFIGVEAGMDERSRLSRRSAPSCSLASGEEVERALTTTWHRTPTVSNLGSLHKLRSFYARRPPRRWRQATCPCRPGCSASSTRRH